ncbi:histidine phosphatase family protein [Actinomycetes bacterium KLBMP 9797]
MTVVQLARHGQTPWHRPNRYTGSSDVDLDEVGVRQADALGRWAAGADLAALACSDLRRAVRTAAPAAAATGLAPLVDKRLRELDFGLAEGRTLADVRAEHPEVAERFVADPAVHPFPGGEAPADAVSRALAALHELAAATPDGTVLVIAHSTLIRLVVCAVLGVPLGEYRRKLPRLAPASRTALDVRADAVALLAYNVPLDAGWAV